MFLLGLTGGIASGKSTISRRLSELGATTIDADALARLVVSPGWPALAEIARVFGTEVIGADGRLDRAALASTVFADPEKLERLNAIVHPAIHEHVLGIMHDFARKNPRGVLVYEIPLLLEADHDYPWDLVVTAEAPDYIRIERLMKIRGMTEHEARARLANQATNEERRAVADVVIDTSGTLEDTIAQTDALWRKIQSHSPSVAANAELGE